jgi:hypothetical protein
MKDHERVPLPHFRELPPDEMRSAAARRVLFCPVDAVSGERYRGEEVPFS